MAIIRLKRARNSLLNVSKLPSEILGEIFCQNVALEGPFGPLEKRSHNFLFVCHHWFGVASDTPGIWAFWGNHLEDWMKRYLQHPTAPLDLILNGGESCSTGVTLDDSLRSALKDRAARDTIRRIHLTAEDSETVNSIISSLAGCEGIQSSSVESIILRFQFESLEASDFFAYYRFPKLQLLNLYNCTIPSWDLKASILTNFALDGSLSSPTIPSFQILSILRSNPLLQELSLGRCAIPDDGGDRSPRVSLVHLRDLKLTGRLQDVFTLLHQLDYPANTGSLSLNLWDSRVQDISGIIGPFLRDYFRRRRRSEYGLKLLLYSQYKIGLSIMDLGLGESGRYAKIVIRLGRTPPQDFSVEVLLDLIAFLPREEITLFATHSFPVPMEAISAKLPYLKVIVIEWIALHIAFSKSNVDQDEVFPSLDYMRINLYQGATRFGEWEPLTTFLGRLASSGNRLDTLEVLGDYLMGSEVEERIRGVVRKLIVRGDDESETSE